MRVIKIGFWIFLIILINFIFTIFYASGNYNHLWGNPSPVITYNPQKVLRTFLYAWDDSYNLGGTKIFFQAYLLISPLFLILHKILNPKYFYFIYKFSIVAVTGISMFYFSKLMIKLSEAILAYEVTTIFRLTKLVKSKTPCRAGVFPVKNDDHAGAVTGGKTDSSSP